MPFIAQRQLAEALRSKAEADYRKQLRASLSTPGLPAEQRREIQRLLGMVGQPKVYDAGSPPLPGAIVLPPSMDPLSLKGMKKGELVALAKRAGVPTKGTKADLIDRLLAL